MPHPRRLAFLLLLVPALVRADAPRPSKRQAGPTSQRGDACVGVPALTKHEIRMGVLAGLARVRACSPATPQAPTRAPVQLVSGFAITRTGSVARPRIASSSARHPGLERCVLAAVSGLRFARPRYDLGTVIKVNYPFVLGQDERAARARRIEQASGDAIRLADDGKTVTLTLPARARERLAAVAGYRLPETADLDAGHLPVPFALLADLDRRAGDELALVLVRRDDRTRWRLVVLRHGSPGEKPLALVDSDSVARRIGPLAEAGLFLTLDSRCFCGRVCLGLASHLGRSLEYEWDGKAFGEKLEEYVPR